MLLPLICLLAVQAVTPQTPLDPSLLADIFGSPPTTRPSNLPPRLEEITVRPTPSGAVFTNSDGDECQCVPYYLCDNNLNGLYKNNASVTGYGVLDVRFGANDNCQESVERCCRDVDIVPEPEPVPPVPEQKGCGYRNPNGLDFTITGGNGNEAQFGEFPWVIALLAADASYAGVGVLIHPQIVLTGAHVAAKFEDESEDSEEYSDEEDGNEDDGLFNFPFQPGTLTARAGEWDTQTNKERLKSQERIVDGIVVREDFNPKNLKNDLALLHLQTPFDLDLHINTLCLPEQDEDFDNYRGCVANGWGKNVFGRQGRYAVILKKVEVDMVPFQRCESLLRKTRLGINFKLHQSFVCAGGEEGKDTCQGDGGAPLACPIGNDRYKLTGLVAWGIGCGQRDVPAVYARVAAFRRWLDDVAGRWGLPL